MGWWSDYLRRYRTRKHVRPWALAAPVLVLVICLPLLRPLRWPDPRNIGNDERLRLATVQALVEGRTLAIQPAGLPATAPVLRHADQVYADQPPMLATLLSPAYWIMMRLGWTLDHNSAWVRYMLTLVGATIPVAGAAGMVYRMARIFELHRTWRAALSVSTVAATGLIGLGVVLNPHAPAAALLVAAAACLIHVIRSPAPTRGGGWLGLAGFCATLAAVIDPPAAIFPILLIPVLLTMRWKIRSRMAGLLFYLAGVAPPLFLHVVLMESIGLGPWRMLGPTAATATPPTATAVARPSTEYLNFPEASGEEPEEPRHFLLEGIAVVGRRFMGALIGRHGMFTHFPILLAGLAGMGIVIRRHWPAPTKMLAGMTAVGGLLVILLYRSESAGLLFADGRLILFLPLLLFWAGAWLRRSWPPVVWSVAAGLLAFSLIVSLIGAAAGGAP